jgi:ABC-type branched-subunit amino acid transport system ATPase component
MSATVPALEVRGLTVAFGNFIAVENFEISCARKTVTVHTGPNGAGKTTVFNALMGACRRRTGTIRIDGLAAPRHWTPALAFACGLRRTFQIPRHWPSLNLAENVALPSDGRGAEIYQRLAGALPGADSFRSPSTLSLGQRRMLEMLRLELARGERVVALLDEPLSGLDRSNASRIVDAVGSLRRDGAAILIVDHEPLNWPDRDATVTLGLPGPRIQPA